MEKLRSIIFYMIGIILVPMTVYYMDSGDVPRTIVYCFLLHWYREDLYRRRTN